MFGQDRYRRRYWILPQCGGIFVEGMESGEGKSHKRMVAHRGTQGQDMVPVSGGAGTVQQGLHPQPDALRLLSIELSPYVVLWYLFLYMKDQVIPFKTRISNLEVFSCTSTCYDFTYLQGFLTLNYSTFPYGSDPCV